MQTKEMASRNHIDLSGFSFSFDSFSSASGSSLVVPSDEFVILPGFCDVHVHLREPGFSYKETILTGSKACARGGYTDVCAMPNLNPVPDSVENLKVEQEIIDRDAVIGVHPYGAITVGEKGEKIADLEGMASGVIAFSDDGKGVQDRAMMKEVMIRVKALGKMIAAHCEDNRLLFGGYIHDGEYARLHGHKGICSKSEWGPIERDLELAAETGCAYHVCHISCKESVELIRQAKKSGVDVTCETGPHYLIMNDSMLQEDGKWRMNPPIRSKADQEALLEGLLDGTIDMIATDHAPHSAQEKAKGLPGSAFGIVGIETAFASLYTHLVRTGTISLEELVRKMTLAPRQRFGLTQQVKDFSVWDLNTPYIVDPAEFLSMGKATPFDGWQLYGRCLKTVRDGKTVWEEV